MSGGSYNYIYCKLWDECGGQMHDAELDIFLKDFVLVLKDLEYWQSADKSEKDYRKRVDEFKAKWFHEPQDKSYELWKESYEVEAERNAKLQQQLDRVFALKYEYRMVRSFAPSCYKSHEELDEYLAAGYEFVHASELIPLGDGKSGYIEYILRRKKKEGTKNEGND